MTLLRLTGVALVCVLLVASTLATDSEVEDLKNRLKKLEEAMATVVRYVHADASHRHGSRISLLESQVKVLGRLAAQQKVAHHHCCHDRTHRSHLWSNASLHNSASGRDHVHGASNGSRGTWDRMKSYWSGNQAHGGQHGHYHHSESHAKNSAEIHAAHHNSYNHSSSDAHHKKYHNGTANHGHHHHGHQQGHRNEYAGKYILAECNMAPNAMNHNSSEGPGITGIVYFRQEKEGNADMEIWVQLTGFPHKYGHTHGFHIHEFGNLSRGCESTGKHYNPEGVRHGAKDAKVRHVADLGNIRCDQDGNVNLRMSDHLSALKGKYSVLGRSLIIHERRDDYGALNNGNAGPKIACCEIKQKTK